ncbi:hypothetical protein RF11_13463 [Thelohanellus kitauei]|uniref:Uncharacterized protein n=1 Tax=Thelohanellus kitauei TaxID=669202 RepID=A0A0C2JCR1_THEKT|nr:hypothetical protein RF11_13463 [Thelohanellus kitauei]
MSTLYAIISTILAIPGFKFKWLQGISGAIMAITAFFLVMFAFSYSIQYNRIKRERTFIFLPPHRQANLDEFESLRGSSLVFMVWPIILVFVLLAALLLFHFFKGKPQMVYMIEEQQNLSDTY